MPADISRALISAARPAVDQRRRTERRPCQLQVMLRSAAGDITATLVDLSSGGIGLRIDTHPGLRPGTPLTLVHPQLGEVPCVLRWATHPRYGAEFQAGHRTLAGVRTYYDGLPPAPGDIL